MSETDISFKSNESAHRLTDIHPQWLADLFEMSVHWGPKTLQQSVPLAKNGDSDWQSSQLPYLSGAGNYGPSGFGVGTCGAPSNAARTVPPGSTWLWPPNDDTLAAALMSTPVKVLLVHAPITL